MAVTSVEYVDHGLQFEYGWNGKVVARSHVAGMSEAQVEREVAAMKADLGWHVVARYVETVGAA